MLLRFDVKKNWCALKVRLRSLFANHDLRLCTVELFLSVIGEKPEFSVISPLVVLVTCLCCTETGIWTNDGSVIYQYD